MSEGRGGRGEQHPTPHTPPSDRGLWETTLRGLVDAGDKNGIAALVAEMESQWGPRGSSQWPQWWHRMAPELHTVTNNDFQLNPPAPRYDSMNLRLANDVKFWQSSARSACEAGDVEAQNKLVVAMESALRRLAEEAELGGTPPAGLVDAIEEQAAAVRGEGLGGGGGVDHHQPRPTAATDYD